MKPRLLMIRQSIKLSSLHFRPIITRAHLSVPIERALHEDHLAEKVVQPLHGTRILEILPVNSIDDLTVTNEVRYDGGIDWAAERY